MGVCRYTNRFGFIREDWLLAAAAVASRSGWLRSYCTIVPLALTRKLRESVLYHVTLQLGSAFQGAYNLRAWVCDADGALLWCTVTTPPCEFRGIGRQAPVLRANGTRALAIGASQAVGREGAGRVAQLLLGTWADAARGRPRSLVVQSHCQGLTMMAPAVLSHACLQWERCAETDRR